jgi:hypothetical protein
MGVATKIFQTRLDAKVYERVKALARFRGVSINAAVGDLLARGVAEIDGRDAKDEGKAK